MKRRAFLQSTFLAYIALNFSGNSDLLAATDVKKNTLIYGTGANGKYFINSFDLQTNQHVKVSVPFRVHSVSELGEQKVLLIEKKGTGCCIVDFKTKSILKQVQDAAKDVFYGHAEIDVKNKKAYFPQRWNGKNHIFIRSLDSLEKSSGSLYQTDKEIHMISMLEDDRLAICIDDKKASSIDVLNLKDHSVRSFAIENNYFRPGHICPVSEGSMYVTGIVGNDYDGAAILSYHFKDLSYLQKDQIKKLKPVFWLSYHPKSNVICGVSPDSNEVLFISHASKKIIKQIRLPDPYGVDISGDQFVVFSPKGLSFIDSHKLALIKSQAYPEMASLLEDFHPILV